MVNPKTIKETGKPAKNRFFKTKCSWFSVSTDGDWYEHGPCEIIAIRYDDDEYSFIHRGQSYIYEKLGDFKKWEYV